MSLVGWSSPATDKSQADAKVIHNHIHMLVLLPQFHRDPLDGVTHGIIILFQCANLAFGIDNGGMILAAELFGDVGIGAGGKPARQVHGNLAWQDDVPGFSA
jgi:hypothetical protein